MRAKMSLLAATILCSACAFHGQVDRATVDYNQAVANSANELTLLNVVRAMERYPLHFTTVSKISGTFKVTGRTGVGLDINEAGGSSKLSPAGSVLERTATLGTEKITPSVGAEVSAGPSFDIGVLDTQEFYQGILSSIDPGLIGNFINLGWPDDLIAAMLVERIEFHVPRSGAAATKALDQALRPRQYGGDEAIWVLENNPWSQDFGRFLGCFRLRPAVKNVPPANLWPVAQMDKFKLGDLLVLDGEKLALSVEEDHAKRMVQRVRAPMKGLTFREVPESENGLAESQCHFELKPDRRGREPQRVSIDIYHGDNHAAGADLEHGGDSQVVVQLTSPGRQDAPDTEEREEVTASAFIVLRSAQAVLYFLGEYAREQSPYRLRDGKSVITVQRGRQPSAFLTARLNGVTYSVPGDPAEHGRSPTAIDLAQQLINLNKSAKDKPATASFRLID